MERVVVDEFTWFSTPRRRGRRIRMRLAARVPPPASLGLRVWCSWWQFRNGKLSIVVLAALNLCQHFLLACFCSYLHVSACLRGLLIYIDRCCLLFDLYWFISVCVRSLRIKYHSEKYLHLIICWCPCAPLGRFGAACWRLLDSEGSPKITPFRNKWT